MHHAAFQSTVIKQLDDFQINTNQLLTLPLQLAGATERENDTNAIRETWSKEKENFDWKNGKPG